MTKSNLLTVRFFIALELVLMSNILLSWSTTVGAEYTVLKRVQGRPTAVHRRQVSEDDSVPGDASFCPVGFSREYNFGCNVYCGCNTESGLCDYCCLELDGECQRERPTWCPIDFSREGDPDVCGDECGYNVDTELYDQCCLTYDGQCIAKPPSQCPEGFSRDTNFGCNRYCKCVEGGASRDYKQQCDMCCRLTPDGYCEREKPTTV